LRKARTFPSLARLFDVSSLKNHLPNLGIETITWRLARWGLMCWVIGAQLNGLRNCGAG
jgi:hypothetical protein